MTIRKGFFALCIVAAVGCVTGPQNDQDIGDYDAAVGFSGYIWGQSDKACVYAKDASSGTYEKILEDTSSSTGSTGYTITGYAWSVTDDVPSAYWDCILPLDGSSETFIKVQETDDGSCESTFDTDESSQDTLDYTYDEDMSHTLTWCYQNNSNWSGFWDDCPVSDDAPVIRVTADKYNFVENDYACLPYCEIPDDYYDCTSGDYFEQTEGSGIGSCTTYNNQRRCVLGCDIQNVDIAAYLESECDDVSTNEWLPAQSPGIICDGNGNRLPCRPRTDLYYVD